MSLYNTKVISEESQVPSGYVRLTEYRHTDERAAKMVSHFHGAGLIPAVKLMRTITDKTGPVWVSKQHADDLLSKTRAVPETVNGRVRASKQHVLLARASANCGRTRTDGREHGAA